MLSLQEFDILNFLFKNQDKEYTQEEISNNTKISLGKVNETLKEFNYNGCRNEFKICSSLL